MFEKKTSANNYKWDDSDYFYIFICIEFKIKFWRSSQVSIITTNIINFLNYLNMRKLSLILVLVILFTVSKAQTFENTNSPLPGLFLSVSSFGDMDNDGDLDLYLAGF